MKKAERETIGGEEINDHVEMAGWGVEEADQKNKSEASEFLIQISGIYTDQRLKVSQPN